MRIGRIIGSITLTEAHPTMRGGILRLLVPLRTEDLDNEDGPSPELVAWDEQGAGHAEQKDTVARGWDNMGRGRQALPGHPGRARTPGASAPP